MASDRKAARKEARDQQLYVRLKAIQKALVSAVRSLEEVERLENGEGSALVQKILNRAGS